ncbi:DUF6984 family protein [Pontibacter populi]|uniref:DUF6984 domain-containing protein n=1 Tax=Pontibacter populi TaxID=890055 RepID=A0ABV1RWN8_9BACT
METRNLKDSEQNLIKHLIRISNKEGTFDIPELVEDLKDGKMGSIRFVSSEPDRTYSSDLVQVEYIDEDNVPVIITLTIDNHQKFYELEFWKVDFEKLVRYPRPNEVTVPNS